MLAAAVGPVAPQTVAMRSGVGIRMRTVEQRRVRARERSRVRRPNLLQRN